MFEIGVLHRIDFIHIKHHEKRENSQHREKRPKLIFLIEGANHSVNVAFYATPFIPFANSLNSLSIRVCLMSIGLVVPGLSSRHCTHV